MIDTIIEIFHGDATDLVKVQKQDGIIAVIHKATQGANFTDSSYSARKKQAKDLGLLWENPHGPDVTIAPWPPVQYLRRHRKELLGEGPLILSVV